MTAWPCCRRVLVTSTKPAIVESAKLPVSGCVKLEVPILITIVPVIEPAFLPSNPIGYPAMSLLLLADSATAKKILWC